MSNENVYLVMVCIIIFNFASSGEVPRQLVGDLCTVSHGNIHIYSRLLKMNAPSFIQGIAQVRIGINKNLAGTPQPPLLAFLFYLSQPRTEERIFSLQCVFSTQSKGGNSTRAAELKLDTQSGNAHTGTRVQSVRLQFGRGSKHSSVILYCSTTAGN